MKILQTIQKYYAILGVSQSSHQLSEKCPCLFSERVLILFLLLECCIAAHFMYMFRVANEFMEYVESICATSGNIIIFVCFATIVFKTTTVFQSIEIIEKLIDTSEIRF